MYEQVLNGQLELINNSSVRTQNVVKKTYRERWKIETSGEGELRKSILAARHDDDKCTNTHTYTHVYIYICIYMCVCVCVCVWKRERERVGRERERTRETEGVKLSIGKVNFSHISGRSEEARFDPSVYGLWVNSTFALAYEEIDQHTKFIDAHISYLRRWCLLVMIAIM